MHGIFRESEMQDPAGLQGGITRIRVRYSDGRVLNFVPDARREVYSEDDLLELKKLLGRASAAAEWAEFRPRSDS